MLIPAILKRCEQSRLFLVLRNIIFIVLFGIWAYLTYLFVQYHIHLIVHPFPLEFREGAQLATTYLLVEGKNPYALAYQPMYMNMYGIVYALVVYPFAKIFGPTMLVHRLVTAFFIFTSCFLMTRVMLRYHVSRWLILYTGLLFYVFCLFPRTTTALSGPHSMGLFLFLCTLFIPALNNYSWKSLGVSLVCALLTFYCKPYFIFGAGLLALYMFLFVSKKKGVVYSVIFVLVIAASIFMIHPVFESYFNNTFFANMNVAQDSASHLKEQLTKFAEFHRPVSWGILIIFVVQLVMAGWRLINRESAFGRGCARFWKGIHPFKPSAPLLDKAIPLPVMCFILAFAVVYLKLGRHGGSWMAYLFHLMTPFLLIMLCVFAQRLKSWSLLLVPLVMLNIHQLWDRHFRPVDLSQSAERWAYVEDILSRYQTVLNSPALAPILIEQGKPIMESGHSEYFKIGAYRHGIFHRWMKDDGKKILHNYAHQAHLTAMVEQEAFDLIILTKGFTTEWLMPGGVPQHYVYLGEVHLLMPHFNQSWTLVFLVPKSRAIHYFRAPWAHKILDNR